jgi:hypothetical protein
MYTCDSTVTWADGMTGLDVTDLDVTGLDVTGRVVTDSEDCTHSIITNIIVSFIRLKIKAKEPVKLLESVDTNPSNRFRVHNLWILGFLRFLRFSLPLVSSYSGFWRHGGLWFWFWLYPRLYPWLCLWFWCWSLSLVKLAKDGVYLLLFVSCGGGCGLHSFYLFFL